MKCKNCGKDHEKMLSSSGFPTSCKGYEAAHEKASKEEKKKFGIKSYQRLQKLDREAGQKHKLIGKSSPSGKVKVAKVVPKDLKKEVKFHEKVENKILRKERKK